MTQDWSKMLKSFRTKTYRSLQEENQVQQRHYHEQRAGESSVTACLITSADSKSSLLVVEEGCWAILLIHFLCSPGPSAKLGTGNRERER